MFIYCESDHLELLSCKCVDRCQWFCALFMQDFALEVEPQQCPAFSERRACPCVLVGLLVFGATAQSGGRQYVGRHLPAQSGPPDSLDHHQPKLWGDGGRESPVE